VDSTVESSSSTTGALVVEGGVGIAKQLNVGGNVNVDSTVESSSSTTGALVVEGGVGIAKQLNVGGNVNVDSTVESSSSTTGALVVEGGVGIAKQLNVGGNVNVDSTVESSSSTTGALVVDGGVGIAANVNIGGNVNIDSNVESSNSTTGALVVEGGVGIAKQLNVGGNVNVDSTVESSSSTTGALVVEGGVGIAKQLNVGGNVNVDSTVESSSSTTGTLVVEGGVGIAKQLNVGGNVNVDSTVESSSSTTGALVVEGGVGIAKQLNVGGNVNVDSTVESSSSTTGALVVDGGVGIAKQLNVGGNVNVDSTVESSNSTTGALVVEGGVGIAKQLNVGGNVNVDSTVESSNSTTGALVVDGGVGIAKNLNIGGTTTSAGITTITNTTESTNTTTGALVVDGGVGIAKNLNIGGTTTSAGITTITNTTESTSTTNGALVVSGGVGIVKNLNVGGGIYNPTGSLLMKGGNINGSGGTIEIQNQGSTYIDADNLYLRTVDDTLIASFNSTETQLYPNVLKIGTDTGTSGSTIFMEGVDGDFGFDNCVIENRLYDGVDKSELLLFKGNDQFALTNTDRIRLRSGQIVFDCFSQPTSDRTQTNVVASMDYTIFDVNIITKVSNTTDSTSTTDGALVVSGGVGIAKTLNVNQIKVIDGIYNSTGTLFLSGGAPGGSGANMELTSGGNAFIDSNTLDIRNQSASTSYASFKSTETQFYPNVLKIGRDDGTSGSTIYMEGVPLDSGFDKSVIETRLYGSDDQSEMLLFKGNDRFDDRIRLRSGQIAFDCLNVNTTDRTEENIVATIDNNNMIFYNNLKIGMGTTTPACALDISYDEAGTSTANIAFGKYFSRDTGLTDLPGGGGIPFRYAIRTVKGIWINSDQGASESSFVSGNSDKRIKKDIENMDETECLDKIRSIQPVSYRYNFADNQSKKNLGFLAQDVESIVPQSVNQVERVIDNVGKYGTIEGNIITTTEPHGLEEVSTSTGKITIHLRETETEEKEYSKLDYKIIDEHTISVEGIDITPWSNEVYVYGCEVSDFRVLDPIPILITALTAMKKMDKTITELQEKVIALERKIAES
jgi:hypothetical protein